MIEHLFGVTLVVAGMLAVYLLPTFIALWRGHRVLLVTVVNVFAGWTGVGWFWSIGLALF